MSEHKLPTHIIPLHYSVEIIPNLETFEYSGTVKIRLEVKKDTQTLVCHGKELELDLVTVNLDNHVHHPTKIEFLSSKEEICMTFGHFFKKGDLLELNITFRGFHNDQLSGFYRSGYTIDGKKKWLVVTQFAATDCRRAFPCWDEPLLKATFDVTLWVDPSLTALSNMNLLLEECMEKNGKMLKKCQFATTPRMSTYLLAFVVGELEYIEDISYPTLPKEATPIHVRVYTIPGQKEQGRFALQVACRTLEYFSEYFDIPYPLPKMDLVAIPDFSCGAMENWGLVTYRTMNLLYDKQKSSSKAKQQVAYVVDHELAHQWFGNLVTMEWWSDIWLNEGFATYVGWMAVDHFYPDWETWTQFVIGGFTEGLSLDALESSHPIHINVKNASEINQIFDAISYSKGASLIRMLATFVGKETFMSGVRKYLKKFIYGNATTHDLWNCISEASGRDIESMMHSWIHETGFPIVSVTEESIQEDQLTLTLQQQRYFAAEAIRSIDHEKDPIWWIPLNIVTSDNPTDIQPIIFNERKASFTFSLKNGTKWKLNGKAAGFYRVKYSKDTLKDHLSHLSQSPIALSSEDRINLISDAFALSKSGHLSSLLAIQTLIELKKEENYCVLHEMASQWTNLLSFAHALPKEFKNNLMDIGHDLFADKALNLGLEFSPGENHIISMKRALLVSRAVKCGEKTIMLKLREKVKAFQLGNATALHPNLREVAFSSYLQGEEISAKEAFDQVFAYYRQMDAVDQQLIALRALASVNDISVAENYLFQIILDTSIVRPQDIITPLYGLQDNTPFPAKIHPQLWTWFTMNWMQLVERYKSGLNMLGRVLEVCIEAQLGDEFIQKLETWKNSSNEKAHLEGIDRMQSKLNQTLEKMKIRNQWLHSLT